jgi:hypothetical protein
VWEFPDQLAVDHTAALPKFVHCPGIWDAHAVLENERIIGVFAPLLVKRGNASAPTIRNNMRPSATTAFTPRN